MDKSTIQPTKPPIPSISRDQLRLVFPRKSITAKDVSVDPSILPATVFASPIRFSSPNALDNLPLRRGANQSRCTCAILLGAVTISNERLGGGHLVSILSLFMISIHGRYNLGGAVLTTEEPIQLQGFTAPSTCRIRFLSARWSRRSTSSTMRISSTTVSLCYFIYNPNLMHDTARRKWSSDDKLPAESAILLIVCYIVFELWVYFPLVTHGSSYGN